MAHGLFWLPLLAVFSWLAWAGWNEYQKVEAYQRWAEEFDQAKYDIYAVLGQVGDELTWGIPTRKGPVNLATFSLSDVQSIQLLVNEQPVDPNLPPNKGRAAVKFLRSSQDPVEIPFTEISLAAKWEQHLQRELQRLQPE